MAVFRSYSCARAYFSRARSGSVYESSRRAPLRLNFVCWPAGAPLRAAADQGCESLLFALPGWHDQQRALTRNEPHTRQFGLKLMRFALVLLAAAARALRPVPVVQRRALLGGGAAAFVRERCR